jgi:hypothetical protein
MEINQGGFTPRETVYTWKDGCILAAIYAAYVLISTLFSVGFVVVLVQVVKTVWFW